MGLLADYLPGLPADPNQNQAARQGLLQFGAALLGGKGNFGSILGQGLAAGAGGYNSALQALQQKALVDAQTKHINMENDAAQAKIEAPGRIAGIIGADQPPAPAPSAPAALVTGQPAPLSSLPQMSPAADAPLSMIPQASTAPVSAPSTPAVSAQPATQAARANLFEQYMGFGDKLTRAGEVGAAKQYYDLAEKLKPEVLKTETLMGADGQPVQVLTFKDGSQKVSQFGALPDNQVVDTGGEQILIDKNTGKKGATFAKSVSPDSKYSRETQYGVQGMIDRRQEKDAKTQVVPTDDGLMLVDKTGGTAKAITGKDGKPIAGVSKPLNDSQSKALLFGTRMQESHKILQSLEKNDGVTTSPMWSRAPGIGSVITAMSSDASQMLDQAKRDFINATLRRESGAAISPGEFDNAEKQYFPQIGDGAKVIAQKAKNRELAIKGMLVEVPEKQRASITPVAELPKKPGAGIPNGWSVKEH